MRAELTRVTKSGMVSEASPATTSEHSTVASKVLLDTLPCAAVVAVVMAKGADFSPSALFHAALTDETRPGL